MKNFLKWIGIIVMSNFAGLLTLPFALLATIKEGFWPFVGAILLCNMIARPVFGFVGGILGGIMKFTETQWYWWVGLSLLSIIIVLIDVEPTAYVLFKIVFFGGYSLYMFFVNALLMSYEK